METHLDVGEAGDGRYRVTAVQGQVVTIHSIDMGPDLAGQLGLAEVPGTTVIRQVVEILLAHEALAAVPAETRLEQLISQYPYLPGELQQRLSTGPVRTPAVETPVVAHLPAEDRPTHT